MTGCSIQMTVKTHQGSDTILSIHVYLIYFYSTKYVIQTCILSFNWCCLSYGVLYTCMALYAFLPVLLDNIHVLPRTQ